MSTIQAGEIIEVTVKEKQTSKWMVQASRWEFSINFSEAPEDLEVGDTLSVFLYMDRRGELAATTLLPTITKEKYGWAKVIKNIGKDGIMVDVGTSREVVVKGEDLPKLIELWPHPGDELYMSLRTDRNGDLFGRLVTEDKVMESFVEAPTSVFNENLKARAYRLLPVGSFFLSQPQGYRIFVHYTEQKAEPRLGEEVEIRIIGVKEDGSLNGSMMPRKQERLGDDAETIWRYLQEVGGKMPFTDKSSPDEIFEMFQLSKAAFKRALGKLMKDGKIMQQDGWTLMK
ncbi:S1 RNA-binding domain-containing protein [Paenisporosarcina cavernae]|uniref:DNA-binding protein n=1 Tax=Paenisporosarcina cavernae TaxID=2320858 RepID=A0A385YV89_9BACL|nr:S1-like domain-containing RNA-binding protein [Paenisporosarcina cavernae]AYC30391.1 DNA-binding protein [Paenisporosarcina cavernae]